METLKFKTNIKCEGCKQKVTPYLNKLKGIKNWEVDLSNSDRVLVVTGELLHPQKVTEALALAGYIGEKMS